MGTEIVISEVPRAYRKFLSWGDAHDGKTGEDGIINDLLEAQRAADSFCLEGTEEDCKVFLEYLKRGGYPVAARKQEPITEGDIDEIAQKTHVGGQQIRALLAKFQAKGLVNKFGKVQIREFLIKIAVASKNSSRDAFFAIERLIDEGSIERLGLLNLVRLSEAAGEETSAVYSALPEYPANFGLPEVLGLEISSVSVGRKKVGNDGPAFNRKGIAKIPHRASPRAPIIGFLISYRFTYRANTHMNPAQLRIEIPKTGSMVYKSHKEDGDHVAFVKFISKDARVPSQIHFEFLDPGDFESFADVYKISSVVFKR